MKSLLNVAILLVAMNDQAYAQGLWKATEDEYREFMVRQGIVDDVGFGATGAKIMDYYDPRRTAGAGFIKDLRAVGAEGKSAIVFRPGYFTPNNAFHEGQHALGYVTGQYEPMFFDEELRVIDPVLADTRFGKRARALMSPKELETLRQYQQLSRYQKVINAVGLGALADDPSSVQKNLHPKSACPLKRQPIAGPLHLFIQMNPHFVTVGEEMYLNARNEFVDLAGNNESLADAAWTGAEWGLAARGITALLETPTGQGTLLNVSYGLGQAFSKSIAVGRSALATAASIGGRASLPALGVAISAGFSAAMLHTMGGSRMKTQVGLPMNGGPPGQYHSAIGCHGPRRANKDGPNTNFGASLEEAINSPKPR